MSAILLCSLMIASALAGCTGGDDDVEGCMDETATNYMSDATKDDASCTFDADGDGVLDGDELDTDGDGVDDNNELDTDGDGVDDNNEVSGCTDMEASNYAASATDDSGDCTYNQSYYLSKYASGDNNLADTQSALENLRMCKEDTLSGVASACEIVAMTSDVDPPMMDPADAYDTSSGAVIENVYDTLYRYEPGAGGAPELVPRLATSYSLSDDGLTYTFTLRDGVYFSNGATFDAEDVRYSWCRALEYGSPDSGVSWILEETLATDCSGLVVNSDGTFSATLTSAYSAFIPTIAFWIGAVTDAETCEENRVVTLDANGTVVSDDHCNAFLHASPLGTNAYVLHSYTAETELVLTPNWLYWEEGNFNLNKVTRTEVAEEATRVAALKDGEVDFASVPTGNLADVCLNADTPSAITGDPAQGTDCGPENSLTVALGIMNTVPTTDGDNGTVDHNTFMGDGEVRKALSYVYDYDTAISDVYDGFGIPLQGPIPLGMPFVETQDSGFSYNLDMARSILDAAGYTCDDLDNDESTPCLRFGGSEVRMFFNDGNVNREANANLMSQNLDLVGIANTVTGEPWGNMLDRMFGTANWDFMFMGWAPDYNDPDNYWFPFVASAAEHGDVYNTGYANAAIDALLLAAKIEPDYTARAALYSEAHDLFMEEPSIIFMTQYLSYHVHSDRVTMPSEVPPATIPWFNVDKA